MSHRVGTAPTQAIRTDRDHPRRVLARNAREEVAAERIHPQIDGAAGSAMLVFTLSVYRSMTVRPLSATVAT